MRLNIATFGFGIGEVGLLRDLGIACVFVLILIFFGLQIAERYMRRNARPKHFRRFVRGLYFGYAAGVGLPGLAMLLIGKLINSILNPSPDHIISQLASIYVWVGQVALGFGSAMLIWGIVTRVTWLRRQQSRNFMKE